MSNQSSKVKIRLDKNGFIITHKYFDGCKSVSQDIFCPFSFFSGRNCKYRCEVISDMLSAVSLERTPTIFIEVPAMEKIDEICETARLLF